MIFFPNKTFFEWQRLLEKTIELDAQTRHEEISGAQPCDEKTIKKIETHFYDRKNLNLTQCIRNVCSSDFRVLETFLFNPGFMGKICRI